jgi:hypothetical protein
VRAALQPDEVEGDWELDEWVPRDGHTSTAA